MLLAVNLGDTVVADIAGHSSSNGAVIADTSTIALTSNDPTVATVPATVAVPAGGASTITAIPVTILAAGSTDVHLTVTSADGSIFEDTATLTVSTPLPGLLNVTLTLRVVPPAPPTV